MRSHFARLCCENISQCVAYANMKIHLQRCFACACSSSSQRLMSMMMPPPYTISTYRIHHICPHESRAIRSYYAPYSSNFTTHTAQILRTTNRLLVSNATYRSSCSVSFPLVSVSQYRTSHTYFPNNYNNVASENHRCACGRTGLLVDARVARIVSFRRRRSISKSRSNRTKRARACVVCVLRR